MKQKNWHNIAEVKATDGIMRKVFSGNNAMLVYNTIQPGAVAPNHRHPHEQIMTITQGICEVTIDDETVILQAGDVLLIPPNSLHGLKALGDEEIINIDIFSPIRKEYL